MFTPGERDRLREALIEDARQDDQVSSAALTGSAAVGAEDAWSDIDLAFAVKPGTNPDALIDAWTGRMYRDHDAIHHMELAIGGTVFRVFLLRNTLQVDLAFWQAADFGATTPKFRLLFGTANDVEPIAPPDARHLVDLAWLHALHARSSIARGHVWQAEYMISAVRDHVLALACLRHGEPAVEGRGMDRLPADVIAGIATSVVRGLDVAELERAFGAVTEALVIEIGHVDAELAGRLAAPLRELTATSG